MGWKYGMIKVAIEDAGTDYEEQINLLVELYPLGESGEYNAFCPAKPRTLEELGMAKRDIERDGINEWFFQNGKFEWQVCGGCFDGQWDWTANP
jgi:hypothetical protein